MTGYVLTDFGRCFNGTWWDVSCEACNKKRAWLSDHWRKYPVTSPWKKKKLNLSELTPQAAQAPAVRWLSCEIRFKVIFSDFLHLAVTYLSIFGSCAIFWLPPQARRIQTRSQNTRKYYTPMNSLLGYLWSKCFFFSRQVFLLISHKARKAKWIEKRSVRSRPVKRIFLQNKIINCTHVLYTYIRVIWTLPCAVGL